MIRPAVFINFCLLRYVSRVFTFDTNVNTCNYRISNSQYLMSGFVCYLKCGWTFSALMSVVIQPAEHLQPLGKDWTSFWQKSIIGGIASSTQNKLYQGLHYSHILFSHQRCHLYNLCDCDKHRLGWIFVIPGTHYIIFNT